MAECVGCGYCCITAPCFAAQRLHGGGLTTCPHLLWNRTRYVCSLMLGTGIIADRYREELACGAGCCSSLNSWRQDVQPRRGEDTPQGEVNPVPMELQLFARCLGMTFVSGDTAFLACRALSRELIFRGWSIERAEALAQRVFEHFQGNRNVSTTDFMG